MASIIDARTLFSAGEAGYASFRIPSIIAMNDRVIAFCEGRRDSACDSGRIDIVKRVSEDGGRTFGDIELAISGAGGTIGNPCPVFDMRSGKLLLLCNSNNAKSDEHAILRGSATPRHTLVYASDDCGSSFQPGTDITAQVSQSGWTWYATGPCHAIQLPAAHTIAPYRLLCACNHGLSMRPSDASPPYISHVIYSDDGGTSWHVGRDIGIDTNECTLALMDSGDVLINMRSYAGRQCRALAISADAGESFGQPWLCAALPDPVCQGSMIETADGRILFSNAADPLERRNLTLHASRNGVDWVNELVVTSGYAAYSDMVRNGRGIYVVYETGVAAPYERIDIADISLGDSLEG